MSVSIEQVKELREATGVSMMACKSALEDADGDYDKAVEILRKKGAAKAADRSARTTSHGVVFVKSGGGKVAMVELQCETDFVSLGEDFMGLAELLADKLLKGEISVEDRDLPEIKDAVLRMGENIKIGNLALVEGENVGDYVHSNNKIGVVVSLKGGNVDLARDIAMHVAATNPAVLSPDEVDEALVEMEKKIWADQLMQEGKPAEIIDKIMAGKEKKFREESALVKQQFVKDPDKTIENLLEQFGANVEKFVRFAV